MNRKAFGGAALWLAAVVGVAGVSWLAIDSAGRQVTSAAEAGLPHVGAAGSPAPAPAGGGAPAGGSSRAGPPGSESSEAESSGTPVTSGSATTGPATSGSATSGPATSGSTTSGDPDGTAYPRSTSAIRSTTAGTVALVCRGEEVVRWSAQPNNGWRVEERSLSVSGVEVEFTGPGELRVGGDCAGSGPVFDVRAGDRDR